MTIGLARLVAQCKTSLIEAGIPDAPSDARYLVLRLLGLETRDLLLDGDRQIEPSEVELVQAAIQRRIAREPVHRILGSREFHGLTMKLSTGTLEPRPDTEILVDAVLPFGREIARRKSSPKLIDLGTGTGAIALALLNELPEFTGVGVDISVNAAETARGNAALNGLDARFITVESNWFERITGRFDIIVSNPPYIRTHVIAELEPEVRVFDPIAALDGGEDGLDAYRRISQTAGKFLEPDGIIAVEIGFDQKQSVTDIFTRCGYTIQSAVSDYGGNDRVLIFTRENDEFTAV